MIYLGDYEPTIYLGDYEPIIMLGDEQVYPSGPFVGIRITGSISFEKTGGTANISIKSSDNWVLNKDANATWLTLSSTAGTSGNTTITATTQDNQSGSALSTTLTAMTTDSAYSATCEVSQAYCNPVICSAYSMYTVSADSSNTALTDCVYDLTGVVEVSDMFHGRTPRVTLTNSNNGTRTYTKSVILNTTKDVQLWDYAFNEMNALEYLEVDMTSTQHVENFMWRCPNLQTVVINNCPTTGVDNFNGGLTNGDCPNLTNVYINGSLPGSCDMYLFNEGWTNYCQNLTVDSLNRILAALPTIGSPGDNIYTCKLGTANCIKLTAAEIAVGTNKGWNIS